MRTTLVAMFLFAQAATAAPLAKATFAGGCFWCMESPFEKTAGVAFAVSGYTGGTKKNPTYEQVSAGGTGHYESVEVLYDPKKVSYQKLLDIFWHNIDPLDGTGQFCDKGSQYRAAIFYHDENQRKLAEESREQLRKRFPNIQTQILPASRFYPAEAYHQDFYKNHSVKYQFYRRGCGRDRRLEAVWGSSAGH